MTIDLRTPTMPGRSTSSFHKEGREEGGESSEKEIPAQSARLATDKRNPPHYPLQLRILGLFSVCSSGEGQQHITSTTARIHLTCPVIVHFFYCTTNKSTTFCSWGAGSIAVNAMKRARTDFRSTLASRSVRDAKCWVVISCPARYLGHISIPSYSNTIHGVGNQLGPNRNEPINEDLDD